MGIEIQLEALQYTSEPQRFDSPTIRIGALVPLAPPGWVEAGQHLLAGLALAVRDTNEAGGIGGKSLELVIRDTAADPGRAAAAVEELAGLGVVALAGEYHSISARAVALKADDLGLPFLCSSAVLDVLIDQPTDWVARLPPPQSRGWRIYAEFLLRSGHRRIAAAVGPGIYWASGLRILRDHFAQCGGAVIEVDTSSSSAAAICDALVDSSATALLLLVGYPEPAGSIVREVRRDRRLAACLLGAPAGQPEFVSWLAQFGEQGAAIPFLRYLPKRLDSFGSRIEAALRAQLSAVPSFVALEGYDTILALADILRSRSMHARTPPSWMDVDVVGTRGRIRFLRQPESTVWQSTSIPVQVVDREPGEPDRFRVLYSS